MRIIILRHGETVENKLEVTQGHNHGQLSELGLKQVKKLANYLKDEKIDLIYCSDLGRCKKSIEPLLEIINLKAIYTPLLRERGKGIFEGRPSKELREWSHKNPGKVPEGGESELDVDKRVKKFLDENMNEWKGKIVLIMTHGGTKISLLKILNKDGIAGVSPNAGITIINIKDGEKRIEKFNYNEYLGDLK